MEKSEFEEILNEVCAKLTTESLLSPFGKSKEFEDRVRQVLEPYVRPYGIEVDYDPHPHAFPDISVGEFGVEVKHTTNDTWRSVANSVSESRRDNDVQYVYVVFGKMGEPLKFVGVNTKTASYTSEQATSLDLSLK